MRRLLSVLLASARPSPYAAVVASSFIRGALNTTSVSGTVSVVQLSAVADGGISATVTLLTFLENGTSSSLSFCGDQRPQFPMNRFVNASFTPGPLCASVIQIVIVI